jgi:hypothetical protein
LSLLERSSISFREGQSYYKISTPWKGCPSMIIHNLHLVWTILPPHEAHAPLVIDPDYVVQEQFK